MSAKEEAETVIGKLNGEQLDGLVLLVTLDTSLVDKEPAQRPRPVKTRRSRSIGRGRGSRSRSRSGGSICVFCFVLYQVFCLCRKRNETKKISFERARSSVAFWWAKAIQIPIQIEIEKKVWWWRVVCLFSWWIIVFADPDREIDEDFVLEAVLAEVEVVLVEDLQEGWKLCLI